MLTPDLAAISRVEAPSRPFRPKRGMAAPMSFSRAKFEAFAFTPLHINQSIDLQLGLPRSNPNAMPLIELSGWVEVSPNRARLH